MCFVKVSYNHPQPAQKVTLYVIGRSSTKNWPATFSFSVSLKRYTDSAAPNNTGLGVANEFSRLRPAESKAIIDYPRCQGRKKTAKYCLFVPHKIHLQPMEKGEIQAVADYLKDLEEGLYEWDYRTIMTQGHLTKLYEIIRQLMDATFKADQELKPLLAALEYKASKMQNLY